MIVKQIWVGNTYRNFNYLVACPQTGEALAVDPLDFSKCIKYANNMGWKISQIVNTHEHDDHTGGNKKLMAITSACVLAHHTAGDAIPEMTRGLYAGDIIKVGNSVELEVLDTPGHTLSHVCLLSHSETPALFSGDTLFNAGAGNCHNGGHPDKLYQTFIKQLTVLHDNTLIYPGHDYLHNNLQFTLDREPDNDAAKNLLRKVLNQDPNEALVTTLAQEKQINTFFRLENPQVINQLRLKFPNLPKNPNAKTVFLKLRELRNSW